MSESNLICRDCGAEFVFSEAEQEYFKAQGFDTPRRCRPCRARKRRAAAPADAARDAAGAVRSAESPGHGGSNGVAAATTDAPDGMSACGMQAPPQRVVAVRRVAGRPPALSAAAAANGAGHHSGNGTASPERAEAAAVPRPAKAPGETFAAVCSLCSAATEVPFRPDGVRPVFCLPCLKRRTR